ncbi:MAG: hypothetical protein VKJ24_13840 [Synechococcales bacterium]|nr:hypothetical protein [Synechococcales bacterium]
MLLVPLSLLSTMLVGGLSLAPHSAIANSVAVNAKLSSSQVRELRSLGIEILVPTDIGRDFRVVKLDLSRDSRFGPGYDILYKNSQNVCFTMSSTKGGIGGPAFEFSRQVKNERLGATSILFGDAVVNAPRKPSDKELDRTYTTLYTAWIRPIGQTSGNFYSFASFVNPKLGCQSSVTPRRAIGYFQSIRSL